MALEFNNAFANIPKTDFVNQNLNWFDTDIESRNFKINTSANISYKFNEYGYRCDSFSKECDRSVLTLGCSMTFGNGIPEGNRFSNIFCNLIGATNWNVGWPGVSNDFIGRMTSILVPALKPTILLANMTFISRREYFDLSGNAFDYRPKRLFANDQQKYIHSNISSLSSDYQDTANLFVNLKLIEEICKNHNVKYLFSIQPCDLPQFKKIDHHFDLNKQCHGLVKTDFARDGGHPGIKSNEKHALNYFKKYKEVYD